MLLDSVYLDKPNIAFDSVLALSGISASRAVDRKRLELAGADLA